MRSLILSLALRSLPYVVFGVILWGAWAVTKLVWSPAAPLVVAGLCLLVWIGGSVADAREKREREHVLAEFLEQRRKTRDSWKRYYSRHASRREQMATIYKSDLGRRYIDLMKRTGEIASTAKSTDEKVDRLLPIMVSEYDDINKSIRAAGIDPNEFRHFVLSILVDVDPMTHVNPEKQRV